MGARKGRKNQSRNPEPSRKQWTVHVAEIEVQFRVWKSMTPYQKLHINEKQIETGNRRAPRINIRSPGH